MIVTFFFWLAYRKTRDTCKLSHWEVIPSDYSMLDSSTATMSVTDYDVSHWIPCLMLQNAFWVSKAPVSVRDLLIITQMLHSQSLWRTAMALRLSVQWRKHSGHPLVWTRSRTLKEMKVMGFCSGAEPRHLCWERGLLKLFRLALRLAW